MHLTLRKICIALKQSGYSSLEAEALLTVFIEQLFTANEESLALLEHTVREEIFTINDEVFAQKNSLPKK